MNKKSKYIIELIRELLKRFRENEVNALGAQLTYYLILSFFPFLIFLITLISYTPIVDKEVLNLLSWLLPENAYVLVNNVINELINVRSKTLLSFSMIGTIWMASLGMSALIRALNKAYNSKENRPIWLIKGLSIFFTIAVALAVVSSLTILVFGEIIINYIFNFFGLNNIFLDIWVLIRYLFIFGFMVLIFAFLYMFVPNKILSFKEVLPGSVFSTIGWAVLSKGFEYYVNNIANYTIVYGSIGAIIVLLFWLYWSSIVMLIGGELNAAFLNLASRKDNDLKV